jgi:hypothetical protein
MMEVYSKLCSVSFRHSYFSDGNCTDFLVKPDALTQELFKKYGFFFKETPAGFVVLSTCSKNESNAFVANMPEPDMQLNFSLTLKNPYLLNMTEIDQPEAESVHYYSNALVSESGKGYLFNSENYVQQTSNNFIVNKNSGPLGSFKRNGVDIPLKKPINGETVCYETKGLDSGVYQYTSDDAQKYFSLSSRSLGTNPFAIISLELNHESILDHDGKMKEPEYTLQLETKQTYWQYILNIKQKKLNLVIESSGSDEDFNQTDEVLSGNKPVIIFTSKQEIPITEKRADYFRLKLRNGDPANDMILISKLPLPGMGVFSKNVEGKLCTPIYVNY